MKSITIRQLRFVIAFLLSSASTLFAQSAPKVSDIVPLSTGDYVDYNQYDTASTKGPVYTSHASFTVISTDTGVATVADSLGKGDPTGVHILHYRFNAAGDMEVFADTAFIASQIPSSLAKNVPDTSVPNKWVPAYKTSAGQGVSYQILSLSSSASVQSFNIPVTITVTGVYLGTASTRIGSTTYNNASQFALIGDLEAKIGIKLIDTETDWLVQGIGIAKTELPYDSINEFGNPISVGGRAKEMASFGVQGASVSQNATSASAIRFYPDPASDEVTLALGQPAKQIFLYDAAGRMVRSFDLAMHNGEAMLYVKDIPNGVYLARVQYADGTFASQQIAVRH